MGEEGRVLLLPSPAILYSMYHQPFDRQGEGGLAC